MERYTHKTEVCGSRPQWPTKSPLLKEFIPRELVLSILGKAGRRILSNRTTTNQQLLTDYLDLITITHAPSYTSEAK